MDNAGRVKCEQINASAEVGGDFAADEQEITQEFRVGL